MGAREKLNLSYCHGSLIVAAVVGALVQSWMAFFLALAALLGGNLYLNEIRPRKHGKGQER